MRVLSFAGTPKQIGEGFGETCRKEIQEFYKLRVKNALGQAKEFGGRTVSEGTLLRVAKESLGITEAYDPDGTKELIAMGRGADLSAEQILALNGLTDLRDVLAWWEGLDDLGGCSSFVIGGAFTTDGNPILGQTWDLATDNMPFVVAVHRNPTTGPATWSLTTAGCLTLIGMNEEGLAVGTTNIRTLDARPGVTYLSILHRMLARTRIEDAEAEVKRAKRAGAHYYYAADRSGRGVAIECSALAAETHHIGPGEYYVHTNHCLDACNVKIEADTPHASSHARQKRLTELIDAAGKGGVSVETMTSALGDHENGINAICRHDGGGISSNGAMIMAPNRPLAIAGHGPPCKTTWVDLLTS